MLALTNNAQEAIEGLLRASNIPAGAGVRIARAGDIDEEGFSQLQITIATVPAQADQVINEGGARVFVEDAATEFLDDKVLDAEVSGEELRFAIAGQAS